jgi:long-chain fatty acid transport protein
MGNKKSLILILLLFTASNLLAGGPEFNVLPRAKTLSLGGFYFAGADGLNSILTNPSGLVLMNKNYLELSINDMVGQQQFDGNTKGLHKSYEEDLFSINGGAAWSFTPDLVLALSYQRAVNFEVDWPFVAVQRTDSTMEISASNLFNRIKINAASLSGALRFNNISVGVTASAYQIKHEASFPRENLLWYNNVGQGTYPFEYTEDAWTFGFNAGLSFEASDRLRIGVMTRSGYSADLSGDAKSPMFAELDSVTSREVDLSSTLEMPWVFGGGVVYNVGENFIINADMQYSLWGSTQKSMNFDFNNSVWQNGLSSPDTLSGITGSKFILNFKNSFDAGIGLEYMLSDLTLRAGYRFSQSPNSNNTYSYLFPTVNENWVSIGLGYTDENFTADLAIAYAFGLKKKIENSGSTFKGFYNSAIVLPTITIRYTL